MAAVDIILWVMWLGIFVVLEARALLSRRKGDTFSEFVWAVLKNKPVLKWVGLGFMVWLTGHFLLPGLGWF